MSGQLSTSSSEHIGEAGGRFGSPALFVTVEREATLTGDLSAIESRTCRGVGLRMSDSSGGPFVTLSLEAAGSLTDALLRAIAAAKRIPDVEDCHPVTRGVMTS